MNQTLARLLRRFLRFQLKKITPKKLIQRSEKKVLRMFKHAAQNSQAFATILAEHNVNSSDVQSLSDFIRLCPVLDKAKTFQRFAINDLVRKPLEMKELASILTSSGQGGNGYALGISTKKQFKSASFLIDLGLDMAFETDRRQSLLINCLPMGVTFQSDAVCVANVSVREDMACAIVQKIGHLFDQIIVCGDPLFLKKFCDFSLKVGVAWGKYKVNVVIGEETFSENFRDYIAGILHIDPDNACDALIGSSMGVGELGLNIFNETRETIALRRACRNSASLRSIMYPELTEFIQDPTIMSFNPLRSFVEIIHPDDSGVGELAITMLDKHIPIPLIRYKTGDIAKIIDTEQLRVDLRSFDMDLALPSLPVIALLGRAKDFLRNGTHVDQYKMMLYAGSQVAQNVSGAFRLRYKNEIIVWEVQLAKDCPREPEKIAVELNQISLAEGLTIEIHCFLYDDFPYGKTLDYERKFVYF